MPGQADGDKTADAASGKDEETKNEKPFQVLDTDEDKQAEEDALAARHPVFEAISEPDVDDPDKVMAALDASAGGGDKSTLEIEDETGMTPLMHAAWKGKDRTVAALIRAGADPNGGNHQHDYTPLHFAALAGKAPACEVLCEAGARTDAINTVKRTPAQMAAFVGHSSCVAVINNFVPKEDVYYFARKQPLEDEPKLPASLAKPLHKLVMSMNTHPVRLALLLKRSPELLAGVETACKVLELMSDRKFKNTRDVNEILSLKFHVIHYVLKDIVKQKAKYDADKSKTPFIDLWIRSMLVGRDIDGYPVFQEDFLRQAVKEFPYKEATLFQALVTNFSHCRNYGEGMTAADYINQSFNGQSGFRDGEGCSTCGEENAPKKCSQCKSVQYCDQECQKTHWFAHKKVCKKLKESQEAQDDEK